MPTTRRGFLQTAAIAPAALPPARSLRTEIDPLAAARRHAIVRTQPTPGFFDGILLGNGDIGVCVTVRPDALGLHIGKNDCWDIRVSEEHVAHLKPFREVLALWQKAGEEAKRQGKPDMLFLEDNIDFFHEYSARMHSSYDKPYPRPWPCGTVWLHWDSRMVRVLRQRLDLSTGVLTIDLEYDDLRSGPRKATLTCFVSREEGHISLASDGPAPVI
ncbi:MAG TPA: twin-arginine translocation signal domain-containing protein, partial [Bryobacteraceae bacterium]|nr:twin-arginine translocation signal domain-containing protein [Bryobacteraceae bacterium]